MGSLCGWPSQETSWQQHLTLLKMALIWKVALFAVLLCLVDGGDAFLLPIQSVMKRSRDPMDSAFSHLARPVVRRNQRMRNIGYPVKLEHNSAYSGIILRGMLLGM